MAAAVAVPNAGAVPTAGAVPAAGLRGCVAVAAWRWLLLLRRLPDANVLLLWWRRRRHQHQPQAQTQHRKPNQNPHPLLERYR